VNFALMALSVLFLPRRNPGIAREVRFLRSRPARLFVGGLGFVLLLSLAVIQVVKDVTKDAAAWYHHAFYTYLIVLAVGTLVFLAGYRRLSRSGVDVEARFRELPSS